jgi:2-hydroxy-3-keto-5-methylthiopentenyl-1-phosphate phosphatase
VRNLLITDFDGTITENDVYSLVIDRYLPAGAPDIWGAYTSGRLTHFEAMAWYLSLAPTDPAALENLLEATEPDPGLADSVHRLRAAGWDVVIVSAGSSWYIERILAAAGVQVPVYSNPGRIEPNRGIVLELPRESPFFHREIGIDKSAVLRDGLARYERVAFAGDGPPDLAPSLLVEGQFRFARGWLAAELKRRDLSFQPYGRWSDIVPVLLSAESLSLL